MQLSTAEERIGELERCLRFYARRSNHRGVGTGPVYSDSGERARTVLGKCSGCDGRGQVATGRAVADQDGPYLEYRRCTDCYGDGIPHV